MNLIGYGILIESKPELLGSENSETKKTIVKNNTILDNHEGGLYLRKASKNRIINNNISNSEFGIRFFESNTNKIINNTVKEHLELFQFQESGGNLFKYNNIKTNGILIENIRVSEPNIFYLNNFILPKVYSHIQNKNRFEAIQMISPHPIKYVWNNNTYSKKIGNYWNIYKGKDLNNDGIGNQKQIIGEIVDQNPLIKPYKFYINLKKE